MSYTIGNLITDVLPRVAGSNRQDQPTGISIFGAATSVQSLIAKNMVDRHSDLLAKGNLNVAIPAAGYYGTLPDDFISCAEKPRSEEIYSGWMIGAVVSYDSDTGSMVINITGQSGNFNDSDWQISTLTLPGKPSYLLGTSDTPQNSNPGLKTFITQPGLSFDADAYFIDQGSQVIITSGVSLPEGQQRIHRRFQPSYLLDDPEEGHEDGWWMSYGSISFYEPGIWAIHPRYYKIIDSTIYVRPKPIAGVNITGKYFQLPIAFTQATDVIPWNGKFDELFREGVVLILTKGLPTPMADPAFAVLFNQEFSTVINSRGRILPANRTRTSQFM